MTESPRNSANAAAPGGAVSPGPTAADPLEEALRMIALADAAGLQVRLMGGLAFHARCRSWTARIDRDGRDIDLATRSRDRKALQALMQANGYAADRQYNALYGHKQLYFVDPAWRRPVDVLIDRMEMSHKFEFADRLGVDKPTLPLAELLLTKVQIAQINRKDILDGLALLSEYPLGSTDEGTINVDLIADLASADWGWWRTIIGNLGKFEGYFNNSLQPGELDFGRPPHFAVLDQINSLRDTLEASPKTTKWKLRARVGERVQWYQEPEEVGHGR
ncbi:MAG TPA: hypothetical protein VID26_11415 [Candidatus Limnocylindrales bacterium]